MPATTERPTADKLTSRERMAAVLSGTLPDRVPFAPTIYVDHACFACGKRFEEALADPAAGQRCMLDAAIRYGADSVRFCMGPEESWYLEKIVEERDGKLAQVSRESGRVEGRLQFSARKPKIRGFHKKPEQDHEDGESENQPERRHPPTSGIGVQRW